MTQPQTLTTPEGRRIAYHQSPGTGPGIVFLGGLKSDMEGTKALWLEDWARAAGRAYLRFDYSGHGQSSGTFEEGAIGDWHRDTVAAITALTEGPQIIVGSSMGGWQALLFARAHPERLAGLVTIAAAPDYTEDSYWAGFSEAQKQALDEAGQVELPSDYMEPYIVTRRMIEDGRQHLVLRSPLELPCAVRLLQGSEDSAVTRATLLRLFDHLESPDLRMTLVKGADHRFSEPECLALIAAAITEVGG